MCLISYCSLRILNEGAIRYHAVCQPVGLHKQAPRSSKIFHLQVLSNLEKKNISLFNKIHAYLDMHIYFPLSS